MSYRTGDPKIDRSLANIDDRLRALEGGRQYANGTLSAKAVRVGSVVLSEVFDGLYLFNADTLQACFIPIPCPPGASNADLDNIRQEVPTVGAALAGGHVVDWSTTDFVYGTSLNATTAGAHILKAGIYYASGELTIATASGITSTLQLLRNEGGGAQFDVDERTAVGSTITMTLHVASLMRMAAGDVVSLIIGVSSGSLGTITDGHLDVFKVWDDPTIGPLPPLPT